MNLSEHQYSGSAGSLDFPKTNKPVESVITYISNVAELFAVAFKNTTIENEPGLNQKLCDLLNLHVGLRPYWFDKENIQQPEKGNSPRTDIGVKTREYLTINTLTIERGNTFFELEAKRLPAPSKAREREYVVGNNKKTGGIERFKIGEHGKKVLYGGLIAFVQKSEFRDLHSTINSWIEELYDHTEFWNVADKLVSCGSTDSCARFLSKSKRSEGISSHISLYHWWVKLN